ncbi:MAG: 2Fe-2S iron-sulfur cluster binding domain-containing protein [Acetobacteraceae bacterium]|nr:2Fe-2S iron-sulfur cluster binding domain-containing protein [Acetobacteraceae bacterium]
MTSLTVNGTVRTSVSPPATPLLDVLRGEFGLTGTRFGCGEEQCGACLVLIDGAPAQACGREIATLEGRAVTTVEGLAGHGIIAALIAEQAGQCGYCLSGMAVAAAALLARNPTPGRAEIAQALDPQLCRCGAHPRILRAVERAARDMAAGGTGR